MILAAVLVCSASCGAPNKEAAKKPEQKQPPPVLNLSEGTSPHFSGPPKNELQWDIHWETGRVRSDLKAQMEGEFANVTATIYQNGVAQATLKAPSAHASRASKTLSVKGGVTVHSLVYGADMTCTRIDYDATTGLLHSVGNVILTSANGALGPMAELWTNADLTKASTDKKEVMK